MPAQTQSQADFLMKNRQALSAVGLLLVLFCSFFWLGFFLGKSSVPQAGAAAAVPAEQNAPVSERLEWRIAMGRL